MVVDEAWILMRSGEGARFLFRMAKASRKRNAGLCVVTQDAADVLGSDLGMAVVSNSATYLIIPCCSASLALARATPSCRPSVPCGNPHPNTRSNSVRRRPLSRPPLEVEA